ncbi:MAG: DUF1801 domain-containing protein [Phycisphaerae bacterium]|nr:DUF1801 domain-containing protein [Phycisphaerae bacterium]
MQSKAKTVAEYLASLPEDRRAAISAVRKVILDNLDAGYEEGMAYGAIGYHVSRRVYPAGYHCDPRLPLPFAGLGSQKHHMSLGIMCNYGGTEEEKWFRAAWVKAGKKLDMGKCCVRFKRLEDVPLEVIAESIRRMPARKYVERYEEALRTKGKSGGAGVAKSNRGTGGTGVKKKKAKRAKKVAGAARGRGNA